MIFSAQGCPDPAPPEHGSVMRRGDRATFKCDHDESTSWILKCHQDMWKGEPGNCTSGKYGTL